MNNEHNCSKILYLVEYIHVDDDNVDLNGHPFPPQPAGHGHAGPGGHFLGPCYCSPLGCPVGVACAGFPNAFYHCHLPMENPHLALVAEEHVAGFVPGMSFAVGDHVSVLAIDGDLISSSTPFLWRGGLLGGRAVVRGWRKCGGTSFINSWHGRNRLLRADWQVREEDTRVLLLRQEGSTGLDLSFATHIFLLERVHNPGLRNQIISRAHRVGASGPVLVQLLQVVAQGQEHLVDNSAINVDK
jgi:hypothetical protein